jgi:MarR family transcriptional regulator, temperature-dependent positive regulator of motility
VRRERDFDLRGHLPYLLRRAHFDAEALFSGVYGGEVTPLQLALLTAITAQPHGNQAQITQEIGLDPNTGSDVIARSAAKGLIEKRRSPTDGRSHTLALTPRGRRMVAMGRDRAGVYSGRVAGRLDAAEREMLVALLRKLLGFGPACEES